MTHSGQLTHRTHFLECGVSWIWRLQQVYFNALDIEWLDSSLPYSEGALVVGRRQYFQPTLGLDGVEE